MNAEIFYPSFRRWVGRQTGKYNTSDNTDCPMANWASHKFGGKTALAFLTDVRYGGKYYSIVPDGDWGMFNAITSGAHTYEALTKRLDAYYTKTGLRRRVRTKAQAYVPTGPLGTFKRGAAS